MQQCTCISTVNVLFDGMVVYNYAHLLCHHLCYINKLYYHLITYKEPIDTQYCHVSIFPN